MKTSKQIREQFLEFFKKNNHMIVDSAPVVLKDDPTLMFTNAGMNQFKDSFLGNKDPQAPRIADTQKCLRVSGKHNDLEEVGHDTYHLTLFEMLGNWSFGDYYKKESIAWAWELLTGVYGIDPDRLYPTIFGGDEDLGLGVDEEAKAEWKKFVPEDRILLGNKKDNFWQMGDTGPCGPCSELHMDVRSDEERNKVDARDLVNQDHPEVIEIWNLVFMEFNQLEDGSLVSLPAKNVDTGMGFERLCMVLQGVKSVYDTDVFKPVLDHLEDLFGVKYGAAKETDIALRVIMDHIRAITFTIADGQIPSATGAGYVVRRILRRASRYAYKFLNHDQPFLHDLVPILAKQFDGVFPEVKAQLDFIKKIIEEEEKSFLRTLERGTKKFEEYLESSVAANKVVDGEFAFTLFDRFGFPFDLTQVMAREQGWTVDEDEFNRLSKENKEKSRAATKLETGDWNEVQEMHGMPEFVGYDYLMDEVEIMRYRTVKAKKGNAYQLVLNKTPFYAEGGGQIGDTGVLTQNGTQIKVLDTKKENDLIVHFVDKLPENPGGSWKAEVDADRRRLVLANHSATHLLHAALRQVLGDHVEQRGSLVSDKVLRFDFSHFSKMSNEEIAEVERIVNAKIAQAIPLGEHRNVPIEEAKSMGAMALFGEKYGDAVRVIVFDPEYSIELCGGTHVKNTAEIRLFKIVSESSIAAGIRRVEALTSDNAFEFLDAQYQTVQEVSEALKNPADVVKAVNELVEKTRQLEKDIEKMNQEKVSGLQNALKAKVREVNGINLINEVIEVPSAKDMQALAFNLRNSLENALVVLGAAIDGKPLLNVIMTKDLEATGKFHAAQLIRDLAKEIKGGGGGQPFFASAGGKDTSGVPAAVKKIEELI